MPWIPVKKSTFATTRVYLRGIVHYANTLPWGATARYLKRIYSTSDEGDINTLVDALNSYKKFLQGTLFRLYSEIEEMYDNDSSENKHRGLMNNTKLMVRLRLRKPLSLTESLLEELSKGYNNLLDVHKQHAGDIIVASDSVLYFSEFLPNTPLIKI